MKHTFRPEQSYMDRMISASRSALYAINEPAKVRLLRAANPEAPVFPLVSIIVPTFNRLALLMTRALPSVLGQTYENFEVLVCAHGCTDGTDEAVSLLCQKDRRVKLVSVPRKQTYPPTAENHWLAGPVAPITAGLREASGDWIARIDDDDEWLPDHLHSLLDLAECGYEFVSSAYLADGKKVSGEGNPPIGGVQTWLYRDYLRFMEPNPDCWRKAWNRVNDLDLAERFRKAGVEIGYLDEVTARIDPRPGETKIGSEAYRENADEVERLMAFHPQQEAGV